MIAAGLSFSCYCAVTVVVDAEAFANLFHEKGKPFSLASLFSYIIIVISPFFA